MWTNTVQIGLMKQPDMGNVEPLRRGVVWAADNGCFAKGDSFDVTRWLDWLGKMRRWQSTCCFAVAPDVVGDAAATLDRSRPHLTTIRDLGYRAAFVAQDGLEILPVPWDAFDCLFVGGSTAWKLSEAAYGLMAEAKARGKHVHAGRVNSLRRLQAMRDAGADSADGTFLAFAPDKNLPRLLRWLRHLDQQPSLFVAS